MTIVRSSNQQGSIQEQVAPGGAASSDGDERVDVDQSLAMVVYDSTLAGRRAVQVPPEPSPEEKAACINRTKEVLTLYESGEKGGALGEEALSRILSLVRQGIDVDQADTWGGTLLYLAARYGHEEVVRLLLMEPSINVNKAENVNGCTPLHISANYGHTAVVSLLLAVPGIKVNQTDNHGWTPLYLAYNKPKVVGLLLAAPGINVNKADNEGLTPLCFAAADGDMEVFELLLAAPGIDVNWPSKNGGTPLHYAAAEGYTEIVRLLLMAPGIDVNWPSENGGTPLHSAAARGDTEIVRLLLMAPDIEVNQTDGNGRTPLQCALGYGHNEVVRLLWTHLCKIQKAALKAYLDQSIQPANINVVRILKTQQGVTVLLRQYAGIDNSVMAYCVAQWRLLQIAKQLQPHLAQDSTQESYANKFEQFGERLQVRVGIKDIYRRWREKRFILLVKRLSSMAIEGDFEHLQSIAQAITGDGLERCPIRAFEVLVRVELGQALYQHRHDTAVFLDLALICWKRLWLEQYVLRQMELDEEDSDYDVDCVLDTATAYAYVLGLGPVAGVGTNWGGRFTRDDILNALWGEKEGLFTYLSPNAIAEGLLMNASVHAVYAQRVCKTHPGLAKQPNEMEAALKAEVLKDLEQYGYIGTTQDPFDTDDALDLDWIMTASELASAQV